MTAEDISRVKIKFMIEGLGEAEGELYYGGSAEKRSVEKRIEFLEKLKNKSKEKEVKEECERLLKMWEDSSLAY